MPTPIPTSAGSDKTKVGAPKKELMVEERAVET
jgi:hypothetical protein